MCKCRMAIRLIIRRRRQRRKAKVNDAAYGDRWFINFPGARREKKRCRPSGDKYLVIPRRVEPFVRKIASDLSYHSRKIIVISPRGPRQGEYANSDFVTFRRRRINFELLLPARNPLERSTLISHNRCRTLFPAIANEPASVYILPIWRCRFEKSPARHEFRI